MEFSVTDAGGHPTPAALGIAAVDEPPNVFADPIDVHRVDVASDAHHRREVTTVRPNIGATAVDGAVPRSSSDVRGCHQNAPFPVACVSLTVPAFCKGTEKRV